MSGCEIKRHHGIREQFGDVKLRWVCPHCLDILENKTTADCSSGVVIREVPRKRDVASFVMPVSGLLFILAVVSEALFYWH